MARQLRVVDHIVRQLVGAGVNYMFGVDGANIEDLYDAAHFCDGMTAILAKHEFSAATMADGYSRAGCGLGVVMATSGGGSLNLVPGLGESLTSRVPVLALVGQPPTSMDGLGSFQDTSGRNGALNAEALFSSVSLYCRRITEPAAIHPALAEAIAAARRGGPAVLLLPKDIQQAELPDAVGAAEIPVPSTPGDIEPIVRALAGVDGPVTILAGEQVARDDARDELEMVRSLLNASTATVPDAKDVSGTPGYGHDAALGVTGIMGHRGVGPAIEKSAVCLIVGTRLGATSRGGLDAVLSGAALFSIGSAAPYIPCQHVHTADLRASLAQLAVAMSSAGHSAGTPLRAALRETLRAPGYCGPGIRYLDAVEALDAALPDGVDIVVDAGNCGASVIHNLEPRRAGRFVVALGMGGMGYSFGAGIGIACGRVVSGKSKRTVVVAGDGAFFMHGMEVHTAVQYHLPITFVLFNNNAHAMCVTREQLYYQDLYSYNRFHPSSLGAGLAAMFPGLFAVDVSDPDLLAESLRLAVSVDGPSVITIECSADEIPTFAPFLNQIGNQQHSLVRSQK